MKRHVLVIAIAIATTLTLPTATMANTGNSDFSKTSISFASTTMQVTSPFEDIPVIVGGVLVGTIDVTRFVVRQGQLYAQAVFTSVTGATENLLIPVSSLSSSCQILNLDLGPIFIDLLGLQIDLSAIHLDITAVPGAGNLLGNLLCAITNLLNSPFAPLSGIATLLNQILGIL